MTINQITKNYFRTIYRILETQKKRFSLFEDSLKCAMSNIGFEMRSMQLTETELCALFGISLLDPSEYGRDRETETETERRSDRDYVPFFSRCHPQPSVKKYNLESSGTTGSRTL